MIFNVLNVLILQSSNYILHRFKYTSYFKTEDCEVARPCANSELIKQCSWAINSTETCSVSNKTFNMSPCSTPPNRNININMSQKPPGTSIYRSWWVRKEKERKCNWEMVENVFQNFCNLIIEKTFKSHSEWFDVN